MVALPPPEEAPHAQGSVPVGGAVTFDAEQVVSCEADTADLVRAYATADSLTLIGASAGRTTLKLRLQAGDVFHLDLEVVNDPPAQRALAVGDQIALSLEGVREVAEGASCIQTTKSADGAQLFVLGLKPCLALVAFTMNDGTTRRSEVVVVDGTRLL